jgi:hypothetical protein
VLLGEDAVEKRRLAGAEIAGEDGDGDLFGHFYSREQDSPRPEEQPKAASRRRGWRRDLVLRDGPSVLLRMRPLEVAPRTTAPR